MSLKQAKLLRLDYLVRNLEILEKKYVEDLGNNSNNFESINSQIELCNNLIIKEKNTTEWGFELSTLVGIFIPIAPTIFSYMIQM